MTIPQFAQIGFWRMLLEFPSRKPPAPCGMVRSARYRPWSAPLPVRFP